MKNTIVSVCSALLLFSTASFASAPQQKTQAPGYYRTMVGDIEITTLFDGFFPMKPKDSVTKMSKSVSESLKKAFQEGDVVSTSVNAFLINTGSRLVLVDSGCGSFFGPAMGHALANLKAAGYSPEQVDEVVITHMHSDHLGGILLEGKAAYPNAVLRIDQNDLDYWLDSQNEKGASELVQVNIRNAIAATAPYKASGKLKPFQGKTEITAGVTALPSYGHTPGHTLYEISSKGKKLLLIGDTLHIGALQFTDPSVSMNFDSDVKKALASRRAIFAEAAKTGTLIGAAHLDFPGMGHVVSTGKGAFRYLPLPYGPVN